MKSRDEDVDTKAPPHLLLAGLNTVVKRAPSQTFRDMSTSLRKTLALRYAGFATWAWDIDSDYVDADPDLARLFDIEDDDGPITSADIRDRTHIADQPRIDAAIARTIATGEPYDERFRVVDGDGNIRWVRGICEVHETKDDGTASVIVGVNMDITDRVEQEDRMIAVVGEMRHRIKNSLAVVNSLISATARETDEIADYVDKLRGRIEALAAAQRAIGTTDEANLVQLGQAIHGAMAPFMGTDSWAERIRIETDELTVTPSLGQAIALTIYELATNAIKYSALASGEGKIDVVCAIDAGHNLLAISWREDHDRSEDGPEADQAGFGTKLIDRLIAAENGTIERHWPPGQYIVEMSFDLGGQSVDA